MQGGAVAYDIGVDAQIRTLVQRQDIREQSALQEALKERGIDLPQATLSRRLKKLGIAKVSGVYRLVHPPVPTLPQVISMKVSQFGFLVLQTLPGSANALAYFLDQKYVNASEGGPGILGTIAGDDTLLVLVQGPGDMEKVVALLKGDFPYLVR